MKQRRHHIPHLLLTIVFILASCTHAHSSLYGALRKYKNKQVSQQAIEKLAQYDHLIRYFSGFSYFLPKHKVSPDFIRALILAESGADHLAVSNKNALGLGQILLTTGMEAAKELAQSETQFRYVSKENLDNLAPMDLFDPAINILLTCYLIAKYNYKFDGKLDLVVSAWNAGENTESLSEGRHAPYQETENLIGKINAYYLYFRKYGIFH
ncbi:lytic transglycosylase domain-containing protein [Desulfopila sp. IMCC35006]|uniref:lytic transglycosylase domain-containing protein n=1 Tax=Desulfopila sp. IMCC35006 TaxID=2569542 RepID=UPI0010AD4DAF|nr:transglycosylase SLT domain-containing protein [Desulfopila sp. IMCC35006]TKB27686.1 lytic transglycosylase domain-containing protein [Desulfopila sp. IMCC35006]